MLSVTFSSQIEKEEFSMKKMLTLVLALMLALAMVGACAEGKHTDAAPESGKHRKPYSA